MSKTPVKTGDEPLHLIAFDADDIAVLSAHLQDAIARVADMTYRRHERRFALLTSRFDWTAAVNGKNRRRTAGLHFDHVLAVQHAGFGQEERDAVLNLLNVEFEPGEAPAGRITLVFSAGAAIRLDVECIDAQLNDIGRGWRSRARPDHHLTDEDADPVDTSGQKSGKDPA
ncbi:MAG: DUF2948 family protein [Hyphomicrobiales bacterium]|nr:DUF2948 family protein [Hyphomicrobiales bacterium]